MLIQEADEHLLARFREEARAVARLQHPNAAFTNTPAEQRLELRYAGERSESAAAPPAPLRATEPAHVAPPGSA